MKKGGIFVIREHDSYDKTYSKYLDIIHYYYDLVITNSKEIVGDHGDIWHRDCSVYRSMVASTNVEI